MGLQRKSSQNWIGGEKKSYQGGTCPPGRKQRKRKSALTLGSPLSTGEVRWDREGASETWRRKQQPLGKQNREKLAQRVPASLRCEPVGIGQDWVLELRLQGMDLGRGLGLTAQRQPQAAGMWCRLSVEVCAKQPGSTMQISIVSAHRKRGKTQPSHSSLLH